MVRTIIFSVFAFVVSASAMAEQVPCGSLPASLRGGGVSFSMSGEGFTLPVVIRLPGLRSQEDCRKAVELTDSGFRSRYTVFLDAGSAVLQRAGERPVEFKVLGALPTRAAVAEAEGFSHGDYPFYFWMYDRDAELAYEVYLPVAAGSRTAVVRLVYGPLNGASGISKSQTVLNADFVANE